MSENDSYCQYCSRPGMSCICYDDNFEPREISESEFDKYKKAASAILDLGWKFGPNVNDNNEMIRIAALEIARHIPIK